MKYGLKAETIKSIQNVFSTFPEVEEVILYGSRAKGNYKPGSDIDLSMIGEQLNLELSNKISLKLDDLLLPYIIDLSIFNQIDNENLADHIKRVGVTFFKK
jgi:predicted nucleotidyltransferase